MARTPHGTSQAAGTQRTCIQYLSVGTRNARKRNADAMGRACNALCRDTMLIPPTVGPFSPRPSHIYMHMPTTVSVRVEYDATSN